MVDFATVALAVAVCIWIAIIVTGEYAKFKAAALTNITKIHNDVDKLVARLENAGKAAEAEVRALLDQAAAKKVVSVHAATLASALTGAQDAAIDSTAVTPTITVAVSKPLV